MDKIKQSQKQYFWGVGNLGEGFISMVTNTYFSIFLTDVAELPLEIVAFVSLFSSIFDFFMVPLSGAILVSLRPMKWGRLRSWLLVCPPLAVIFFLLCFTVFGDSQSMTVLCILVGYLGAKAAWNITYAANVSLTAVMATDVKTKSKLASQRMIGSNAGRLLGNYLTPIIVATAAVYAGESYGYRVAIVLTGIVYVLTSIAHFYICAGCEDRPGSREGQEGGQSKERMPAGEVIRALVNNVQLLITLVIDLTSNVASLVLPSLAVYYYKYCACDSTLIPTHMLIIGLGGIIGAFLVRVFGVRIGRPRKILLGLYLLVAASLFSIRLFPDQPIYFLCISGVIAVLTGMTSPFELNLYMDNAAYYRKKSGQDVTGFIMGLSNMPVKFASIIKSTLIPFTLMAVGYVANAEPTPEMQKAIINAYTLIPMLFPILGFVLLKFFWKSGQEEEGRA
ncbi:MAG: MFS transporter [Lachnospiraceae bacterium]|nr:MFS transporter [Lachnospiraceae bacterium]